MRKSALAAESLSLTIWPELLLAATADEKGAKAAQQQATEFYHEVGLRTRALASAAADLQYARRYAAAADLAETLFSDGHEQTPAEKNLMAWQRVERVDIAFDRPAGGPERWCAVSLWRSSAMAAVNGIRRGCSSAGLPKRTYPPSATVTCRSGRTIERPLWLR